VWLPNLKERFQNVMAQLSTYLTAQNVHAVRETLKSLLGRQIVLHPSLNGMERFLTAELSAGVVRLAKSNDRGGGHPATCFVLPDNTGCSEVSSRSLEKP
jgi:hypothetical protein